MRDAVAAQREREHEGYTPEQLSLRARAQAKLLATQRKNELRFAADPWVFIRDAVYTLDQIDGTIKRFPDMEYLAYMSRMWHRTRQLAVPKSRRMKMSWLMCALHYWLARFHHGVKIAFVSRKEGRNESEGSAELVWRAKFIHDHLPASVRPVPIVYKFCYLGFPESNAEIVGMGQGADQLRQLTLTAILGDEVAFWEHAEPAYTSMKPTLEGGGRITLISSANPGFFKRLVHDEL